MTANDTNVRRWGGLTSIAGALLFIAVFAIVITLAGPDPAGLAGPITKFPDIRYVRTVENGLYLLVMVLWIPLYLSLYQVLRTPAALFGTGISISGLVVLASGALPHVATARLADLYQSAEATAADQATLVLVWQSVQGLFDALLITGLLMVALGIIVLATAFAKAPAVICAALGICALGAGIAALVDPQSPVAAIGMFALIAFHLIAGWRLLREKR